MSYCRWSDNCFQSDVYCYEVDDGFQIHVASRRYVSDKPKPPKPNDEEIFDYSYFVACLEWAKQAELKSIGLPCDGKSYGFDTAAECIDKLIELREMGYHVPQRAIDALSEELKNQE